MKVSSKLLQRNCKTLLVPNALLFLVRFLPTRNCFTAHFMLSNFEKTNITLLSCRWLFCNYDENYRLIIKSFWQILYLFKVFTIITLLLYFKAIAGLSNSDAIIIDNLLCPLLLCFGNKCFVNSPFHVVVVASYWPCVSNFF